MSRKVFVAASISRSRIKLYFSHWLQERCSELFIRHLGVFKTLNTVSCNWSSNAIICETSARNKLPSVTAPSSAMFMFSFISNLQQLLKVMLWYGSFHAVLVLQEKLILKWAWVTTDCLGFKVNWNFINIFSQIKSKSLIQNNDPKISNLWNPWSITFIPLNFWLLCELIVFLHFAMKQSIAIAFSWKLPLSHN